MPLCFGASGSVRTYSWHQSARCPSEVQIFWPLTTKWSPSRTARVRSDARSEPASGSDMPWHQMSSARIIRGSSVRFCASVPYCMIAGAMLFIPITLRWHRHPSASGLLGVDQLLEHRRTAAAVLLRPGDRGPAGVGHRRVPSAKRLERGVVPTAAAAGGHDVVGQVRGQPRAQLLADLFHLWWV